MDYTCKACGAYVGGPNVVSVGPLSCWRADCPGKKTDAAKLKAVK